MSFCHSVQIKKHEAKQAGSLSSPTGQEAGRITGRSSEGAAAAAMSSSDCSVSLQHNGFQLLLPCMFALFGAMPHGTITGRVMLPPDRFACAPMPAVRDRSSVVVAERGNCSMSTKASHAESAGASVLLVTQNDPRSSPMRMQSTGDEEGMVSLVAAMVSYSHGEIIRAAPVLTLVHNTSYGVGRETRLRAALRERPEDPAVYLQLARFLASRQHHNDAQRLFAVAASLPIALNDRNIQLEVGGYFGDVRGLPNRAFKFLYRAQTLELEGARSYVARLEAEYSRAAAMLRQDASLMTRMAQEHRARGARQQTLLDALAVPLQHLSADSFGYAEYLKAAQTGRPTLLSDIWMVLPWTKHWSFDHIVRQCADPFVAWVPAYTGGSDYEVHGARSMQGSHTIKKRSKMRLSRFTADLPDSAPNHLPGQHTLSKSRRVHDYPVINLCLELLHDITIPSWFAADLLQTPASCAANGQPLWSLWSLQNDAPALSVGGRGNTNGLSTSKFSLPTTLLVLEGAKRVSVFPRSSADLLLPGPEGTRRLRPSLIMARSNETLRFAAAHGNLSWWSADLAPGDAIVIPGGCPYEFTDVAARTTTLEFRVLDAPSLANFRRSVYDTLHGMPLQELRELAEATAEGWADGAGGVGPNPYDPYDGSGSTAKAATATSETLGAAGLLGTQVGLSEVTAEVRRFFDSVTSGFVRRSMVIRASPKPLTLRDYTQGKGVEWAMSGFQPRAPDEPRSTHLDSLEPLVAVFDEQELNPDVALALDDAATLYKLDRTRAWRLMVGLRGRANSVSPIEALVLRAADVLLRSGELRRFGAADIHSAKWSVQMTPPGVRDVPGGRGDDDGNEATLFTTVIFLSDSGGPTVLKTERGALNLGGASCAVDANSEGAVDVDAAYLGAADDGCRLMLCHPRAGRAFSFRAALDADAGSIRHGFFPQMQLGQSPSSELDHFPPRVTVTVQWFGERIDDEFWERSGNGGLGDGGYGTRWRDEEFLSLKDWVS